MNPDPRPGVFLDRDGTLIRDCHYLGDPDGVELLPGAADAIVRLNHAGVPVILITNQSGIGRGYFSEADFRAVQQRIAALLDRSGASLDGVYHCPHAPGKEDGCDCRKPAAGLFRRAAAEHGINLGRSFFIGDRLRDVIPAVELGGTGLLVQDGEREIASASAGSEIQVVGSLGEAADRVLSKLAR